MDNLQVWLVDHPTIAHFEWKPNQTWGASPLFLSLTLLSYLLLPLTPLPTLTSSRLRPISALHSLILCLLSFAMALGCSLSALSQAPNPTWIFCFPPRTPPRGPVFFWAYVFYLSKLLEFVDTLLILLGGTRRRRLSFLHVYHHAAVVVMCYVWLSTSMSLMPVALVTNAAVHVVMYGYYLVCALGWRPWWKVVVTNCQIIQFVFSFAVSGVMLHYHFTGSGCSGFSGWCFNAVFNATLLALFLDFHFKNYAKRAVKTKSS